MPTRSELPGNLNRNKLTKALERLGFIISRKGGKGGHIKAIYIRTQKSITIPSENLRKDVLYYIVKEIEKNSSVTWNDINKEL